MARPTSTDVHSNVTLPQVSVRYESPDRVARRVLPVVFVTKSSDDIRTYDNDHLRDEHYGPLGDNAPAAEVDFGIGTTSYTIKRYGVKQFLSDRVIQNQDAPLNLFVDAGKHLLDRLETGEERVLATFMNATTNFTGMNTSLSGSDQWHQYGESVTRNQNGSGSGKSNPLIDILTAMDNVRTGAGRVPNVGVVGPVTWMYLRAHPDVVGSIYGAKIDGARATEQAVANLLGLDELIVGNAIYESAVENKASSMANVWGKHFWLIFREPRPSLNSASWGYTLVQRTPSTPDRQIIRWRNNDPAGWWVKAESAYVQKVLAAKSAYMVRNAVA